MTTESKQTHTPRGGRVLLGAASWGLATAIAAVVVALIVRGGEAGVGAVIGGLATLLVLAVGTWLVLRVASTSPAASLLVALVVFTAQGGLLLLTLAVLSSTTDGAQTPWASIAVIAVTLAWTTMFAVRVRKERIPVFDLPDFGGTSEGSHSHEASTR
jgi:hypothetical protein